VASTDELVELPEDRESLQAMVRALQLERDQQKQRVVEQQRRVDDLHVENLRLQVELARLKKWYYGPRADRLRSGGDLAQLLLGFAEAMDRKAINPADLPSPAEPEEELRRVKRRKGRRRIADFEHLPVTTHVHELNVDMPPPRHRSAALPHSTAGRLALVTR
jgi:chromosome segregation ATPase